MLLLFGDASVRFYAAAAAVVVVFYTFAEMALQQNDAGIDM